MQVTMIINHLDQNIMKIKTIESTFGDFERFNCSRI
mgnify:FL=1|jgi:hypothetical protein